MVRRQGEGHFTTSPPTHHAHTFWSPTQGLTEPLRGLLGKRAFLYSRETKAQRIGNVGFSLSCEAPSKPLSFSRKKGGTSKGRERIHRSQS